MQIGRLLIIISILQLKIVNYEVNSDNNLITTSKRNSKKLWSILTLVHFRNDACRTINSTGTCFTKKQCIHKRGTIGAKCANGFGVCCSFSVSCGDLARENCTYFRSPGYPNQFTLRPNMSAVCSLQILKMNNNICQIRLDLVDFDLFGVQEGECQVDIFNINNGGLPTSIPSLCGNNSGQHIYINVPRDRNLVELQAIFQYLSDNPNFGRKFNVKITQIECTNQLMAPSGCLQYFTGQSGTIMSFNYAGSSPLSEGYPINQNYGICIKKELGFCSIRYSSDEPFQFGISDSNDGSLMGSDCDGENRDDYLVIPGGRSMSDNEFTTSDRYCGGAFNPVTTTLMPYVINVVSGDKYDGEVGFKIKYEQIPCT